MRWDDLVDTKTRTELERLTAIEHIFDPFSVRNLDRIGVAPGWRCLEVGAGAGSIARHLGELAGPGNVIATDISTDHLEPLTGLGIEVMRHDVTVDDAPGEFDVIHCRFVLDHLPDRDEVIKRMATWLRPDGWLLIECASTLPESSSHEATRRALEALGTILARKIGTDSTWSRGLPLPLEHAGLSDCHSEGMIQPARGGSMMAKWLTATHKLIEVAAVEAGVITQAQLDDAYALYNSPSFVDYTWLVVAAWGRRV